MKRVHCQLVSIDVYDSVDDVPSTDAWIVKRPWSADDHEGSLLEIMHVQVNTMAAVQP
jgi:hypothetical protein